MIHAFWASSNLMAPARTRFPHQEQWAFCHRGRVVPHKSPRAVPKVSQATGNNIFGVNP